MVWLMDMAFDDALRRSGGFCSARRTAPRPSLLSDQDTGGGGDRLSGKRGCARVFHLSRLGESNWESLLTNRYLRCSIISSAFDTEAFCL